MSISKSFSKLFLTDKTKRHSSQRRSQVYPASLWTNHFSYIHTGWKHCFLHYLQSQSSAMNSWRELRPLTKQQSQNIVSKDMMPTQKHIWDPSAHWDKKLCTRISLWKGKECHRPVLFCSFAPLCSDLSINQIITFHPHPGSLSALLSCTGCRMGSPRLNLGSQTSSQLPTTLTWSSQWAELQETETCPTS